MKLNNRFCIRFGSMILLAAVLLLAGTACATQCELGKEGCAKEKQAQRIKTGFYVERGSQGSGVLYWARLLTYSPQLDVVLLEGEDIREGKLDGLQLLMIPGGNSRLQCELMKPEGVEKLRKFVADGGSYVGVCAGFHCTLNRPERLQLLPFEYDEPKVGNQAIVAVDLSEKGGKLLGVPAKRYMMRYSHGPVARPGKQPGEGWGEVLGVYKSTVGPIGKRGGDFFDTPAIIHGRFGKGKVIATSFHPESLEATHDFALGCVYAVTGVRPVPVYPKKNYRPLRVGFYSPRIAGKRCIEEMLKLDRHPDLDVRFIDVQDLNAGQLEHLDVFVVPNGVKGAFPKVMKSELRQKQFQNFMDRGGKVLVSGEKAEDLPKHKNMKAIPENDWLLDHVLKLR